MFFPERIYIKENDIVLEIGPGGTPFYRSDVLFDRFYDSEDAHAQSGGTGVHRNGKPLFVNDHSILPFKDKSFDYVICSHVLEHVPVADFDIFMKELFRVAQRGYIEFPSIFYEKMFNFNVHKNILFFSQKDSQMLVVPKDQYFLESDNIFHSKMRTFLSELPFSLFILLYKEFFFIGYEYASTVDYKICTLSEVPSEFYPAASGGLIQKITTIISNKISRKKVKNRRDLSFIQELLKCPECNSDKFDKHKESMKCVNCSHELIYLS